MKKLSKILCFVSMVSLLPMNVLADGEVYDFTIDGVGYSFGHGYISYVSIDVPSMMLNDKTLVPVRAVSEALGLNVEWIAKQVR